MDLKLQGKRALVSGAGRGTGQIIAKALADEGAVVIVHGPDEAACAETMARLPDSAVCAPGDLETDAGADQVAAAAGAVDILIANLGGAAPAKWGKLTSDDWLAMYNQNVLTAVRLIDRTRPFMEAQGWGRIIGLSTIGALIPNKVMPHYYASKGAMQTMFGSLAKDLLGTGVGVNLVAPGLIATDEVIAAYCARAKRKGLPDDWPSVEKALATGEMPTASGRLATREEVAALVTFLASPVSDAVSGTSIRVDGGASGLAI